MRRLKSGIRFWITLASLTSFVGGWIMLVHAPKPDQGASLQEALVSALPTLEPLPPLPEVAGDERDVQGPSLFDVQPRVRSQADPFFITGGS